MALTRTQLKALWITGYEPTQSDFSNFFDSFFNNLDDDLLREKTTQKDATGGYVGLTLFKINFKNALNTFTSFFTNANTAARTYTFQNKDGTIADLADIAALGVTWINTFVPTITASAGTITTKSAICSYYLLGKTCFFTIIITITTNGTGSGYLISTLPFTCNVTNSFCFGGANIGGLSLRSRIIINTDTVRITKYDNSYPGANGEELTISGFFQTT